MEGYLAEIRLFAGDFAPQGWAFCQGQLLPISQNIALFSLLGTFYGGDGQQTFGLPNLPSPLPSTPMRYIICISGLYPTRN
jgi:microcystin-dependent protein